MLSKRITVSIILVWLGLTLVVPIGYADQGCLPCGEIITNLPMPSYESHQVQPYQNYIATYQSCLRSGWNGFYLGTGFGYGSVNYNLQIPGILSQRITNSYITEYISLGYAYSFNRFFIAGELGYYYDSVTDPVFYMDPSSFSLLSGTAFPISLTTLPCSVRLDINSQNNGALDILPGFVLSPRFVLYSRLGVGYSGYSWRRRLCFPVGTVVTVGGLPVAVRASDQFEIVDEETDSVFGFRLGGGAAFAVNSHLSFNINYVHTFSSRASFTPNAALITAKAPLVLNATTLLPSPAIVTSDLRTLVAHNAIDPSRNEVLFGITVSF